MRRNGSPWITPAMIEAFPKYLPKGRARAVKSFDLAPLLGLPAERTELPFRELARAANLAGYPVCSCPDGFFLAETAEEVLAYAANLRARCTGILARVEALKGIAQRMLGEPEKLGREGP